MRLHLIRYARFGKTVLGFILISGRPTILTLEDYEEMVDEGFYHLVHFSGVKYKDTHALIGDDVAMYPELGVSRSTCIFHGGDTHEDTSGCVLVGHRFHFENDTPNIDGGADAMVLLRAVLVRDNNHYLTIEENF